MVHARLGAAGWPPGEVAAGRSGAGRIRSGEGAQTPMRFVIIQLSPSGGLFQFSYQLGLHLARRGHDVELLTGPDPELVSPEPSLRVSPRLPTWHPGAPAPRSAVMHKARRVLRAVQHVRALVRVLRHLVAARPDVVMWHPLRFPIDSFTVVAASRLLPGTTMSTVLHEPWPLTEQKGRRSLYRTDVLVMRPLAAAIRSLDVIFVLGEKTREIVSRTWRPRARLAVIPHGDEGVFQGDHSTRPVSETGRNVLFFGTWTRYKGIEVLLDAFGAVRAELPDARLTMAGAVSGDLDLDAVRERAESLDGVTLLPRYIPMEEVPRLMGEARLVALPYLRASQSGVAHLAQTFSRPVVASDVGDIPAAVPDGVAGRLVPTGDTDRLAEAMLELLRDPEAAEAMGRAGRSRLEQEASWADIAESVDMVLSQARAGSG